MGEGTAFPKRRRPELGVNPKTSYRIRMNCIPLSLGLSGANARVPEGRDPRSSPHQTPEGGSSVSFLVFLFRRARGCRSMALFPPLVPPHGAFGEPGPCWAVETSSGTPEARFLGEAETASHQACTHVFHAPWAAPRPPRPPERCVFGGGRCRAEIQGPLPLVWRERGARGPPPAPVLIF